MTHRAYPFLRALFSPIKRYRKLFRRTVPERCAADSDSFLISPTRWFVETMTVTECPTHRSSETVVILVL